MRNEVITSASALETHRIAIDFGKDLAINAIVAVSGDLGAGKTAFIRGVAEGASKIDPREVCSPTFTFLNVYSGEKRIYHFDLYRLPDATAFYSAGFGDFLEAGGICCIEWPEKIPSVLPNSIIRVNIVYLGQEERKIEICRP